MRQAVAIDGPFIDPGIPDGETSVYRGSVKGEIVGEGTLRVEAAADAYVQRIDMLALEELDYALELRFARRDGFIHAEHYALRTHYRGEPVAVEEGWFRNVRVLHWGAELISYPRDIAPLLGCAVALRGLDFAKGTRRTCSLWLANTVFWDLELRVERREDVEVPAGRYPAWRVRARPSFEQIGSALDKIVGALLPPFVLHFEASPPHRLLRFEFPTGPFRWNPRGVIEAVALD
ncbi:MAG: hypothetical protein WKF96_21470 [Solirubrobacteraceae bacterium]